MKNNKYQKDYNSIKDNINDWPDETQEEPKPLSKNGKKNGKGRSKPIVKVKKAVAWTMGTIATGIGSFLIYNLIATWIYNSKPPVTDPFKLGDVFNSNGNSYSTSAGQIELDDLTQEEKQLLTEQVCSLLCGDASMRLGKTISRIDKILSITTLPYDLKDAQKPLNYISILFEEQGTTYALNYLTSKEFSSDKTFKSDYLLDFVNYLAYDCALDSCDEMADMQKAIKGACPGCIHVGSAYRGVSQTGQERYFIPVYNEDGGVDVYSAWTANIDADEYDPNERLLSEIMGEVSDLNQIYFHSNNVSPNANFLKIKTIYDELGQNSDDLSATLQ